MGIPTTGLLAESTYLCSDPSHLAVLNFSRPDNPVPRTSETYWLKNLCII